MSTTKNDGSWNREKTGHNAPSFTVFGFPTAEPFSLAPKRTSSCVFCHHMHEKGPSKNIFLSFQAISLIPDELQGRGKHCECGLAGGGEGILWVVHECVCFTVSLSEYICIIVKPCLMTEPFLFCISVYSSSCLCEHVCACVDICDTNRPPSPGEGTEEPWSSSQGLVYPIFY